MQLRRVGTTEAGRPVIGGVFPLVNSEGIPLEVVIESLRRRGMVVDWVGFVRECLRFGWSEERILSGIVAAVGDVCGPIERDAVESRLRRALRE